MSTPDPFAELRAELEHNRRQHNEIVCCRVHEVEQLLRDASRYQWLRARDLDTIGRGGVFAGKTPDNLILNEEHLDAAVDAAMAGAA